MSAIVSRPQFVKDLSKTFVKHDDLMHILYPKFIKTINHDRAKTSKYILLM